MARARKEDLSCVSVGRVNRNGQITVPADMRIEIGLEPNSQVILFADEARTQLIVMLAPPGEELFEVANQHARRQRP